MVHEVLRGNVILQSLHHNTSLDERKITFHKLSLPCKSIYMAVYELGECLKGSWMNKQSYILYSRCDERLLCRRDSTIGWSSIGFTVGLTRLVDVDVDMIH